MSRTVNRNISIDIEAEEIICRLFAHGQFSKWVIQKLHEEDAARLKLSENPVVKMELSDLQERAIQVLVRNWGDSRTSILAQRWEGMIKEHGGAISASQLINIARKRIEK